MRTSEEDDSVRISLRVYQRRLKAHARRCAVCRHNALGCAAGEDLRRMVEEIAEHGSGTDERTGETV